MIGLLIGAAVASSIIGDAAKAIQERRNNDMHDVVFVDRSAESFKEGNYLEVIHALLGMGFTDVNAVEIRKYKQGIFTKKKYGLVESVSINGNDSFNRKTRFAKAAHVVVSFHVFKDSPPVVIPELQRRAPYVQPSQPNTYPYQQPFNINVNIDNYAQQGGYQSQRGQNQIYFDPNNERYCEYCESLIPNNAGFCPRCGAPVRKRSR